MMRQAILFFTFLFILFSCKPVQVSTQDTTRQKKEDSLKLWLINDFSTLTHTADSAIWAVDVPVDTVSIPVVLPQDTFWIAGVGDIMMGTNYPYPKYLPPREGAWLFKQVDSFLIHADLTFGNLEGVILDQGGTPKRCKNPDACYAFRMPTHYAGYLKDAGFDMLSTANNHAGDFGDEGRRHTLRVLDSLGIHHAGQLMQPYTSFAYKDITVGFAAFSPNTGTPSIHDLDAAKNIVSKLDSLHDIVIVSFHGGAEGNKYQHVPRATETFYGENRGDVYAFSHAMVDAGADIVFGHGPHVTRTIDVYKNRFIAYSLGNFCTYGRFNLRGPNGIAPLALVQVNREGAFQTGKIIPIKQVGEGGPQIDEQKKVIYRLQELLAEDVPEAPVYIDDSGRINYIEQN